MANHRRNGTVHKYLRPVCFLASILTHVQAFCFHPRKANGLCSHFKLSRETLPLPLRVAASNDEELMDDSTLLKVVTKKQLEDLCTDMNLSTKGNKETLLKRLRQYAADQEQKERSRRLALRQRVEEGASSDNPKERFEIIEESYGEEDGEDDEDFLFYFKSPEAFNATTSSRTESQAIKNKPAYIPNARVTAPPPPTTVNKDGERVVTIYSSTDQNDLTGIAAAQPGQSALGNDALTSSTFAASGKQPWDAAETHKRSESTSKEVEQATEEITELVAILLSMSGAPAFRGLAEDISDERTQLWGDPPRNFVGFHPGSVPAELLSASSRALRTHRGKVLDEVLRGFEMQAIGQDGIFGDNEEKGGGHYREVAKVRAFLEGYRTAEVRRIARETTAMLLDRLVAEGIEGLDMALATMTRSSDDTNDYAGDLNDSLLEYLSDAIRQQERKMIESCSKRPDSMNDFSDVDQDFSDSLWEVTIENGHRVESLDPNSPKVKDLLVQQSSKLKNISFEQPLPDSPSEKLLLLLKLLRERLKAEAAYGSTEYSRNLRLLAYCTRISSEKDREQFLLRELGSSIDRLDSFLELVTSSVEYCESTSHQLQPAKTKQPLNVGLLKRILVSARDIRERQGRKASGLT